MTLSNFIKENREELDKCINHALNNPSSIRQNDEERRMWILNDEGLYLWAKSCGVRI
jgi:hypothetical protein